MVYNLKFIDESANMHVEDLDVDWFMQMSWILNVKSRVEPLTAMENTISLIYNVICDELRFNEENFHFSNLY